MPFDPLVHNIPTLLDGSINVPLVVDPATEQPVRIIPTTDAWSIKLSWNLSGLFASVLAGDWHVTAYLEALDGGTDPGQVGPSMVVPLTIATAYSTTINVPPGVRAGVFKLTTAITYKIGATPFPMAAFSEGTILQFFVP